MLCSATDFLAGNFAEKHPSSQRGADMAVSGFWKSEQCAAATYKSLQFQQPRGWTGRQWRMPASSEPLIEYCVDLHFKPRVCRVCWGRKDLECSSIRTRLRPHCHPPPPLQSPGVARDGLPGGGGRRSPSDGVPGGGGGIARVSQGKLWYPPLTQAKRTRVKRLSR